MPPPIRQPDKSALRTTPRPRTQAEMAHQLVGLPSTKSPAAAMREWEELRAGAREGKGEGQDEERDQEGDQEKDVRHRLRMASINIYTHMKLSERFHSRAQSDDNLLPLLLCALHGHDAPDPRHVLRTTRLSKASQLPLAYWDGLYLALVAEIRLLYHDVLQELSTEAESARLMLLHNFGRDGTEDDAPFRMIEFAWQLESTWFLLMSTALLGPLELAVRKEKVKEICLDHTRHEDFRDEFEEYWNEQKISDQVGMLDAVDGMLDPGALSSPAILKVLRESHIPVLRRACEERMNNERSLPTRRAPVPDSNLDEPNTDYFSARASEEEQWRSSGDNADHLTPYGTTSGSHCICKEGCICRDACQYDIHQCRCKTARSQPSSYSVQRRYYEDLEPQLAGSSPGSHAPLAAVSNSMAQMHIAAGATPEEPHVSHAAHAAQFTGSEVAPRVRQRSNTAKSDLVYVPDAPTAPAMPSTKDAYPLDFYGRNSGQRYPKFHCNDTGQLSPTDGLASRNIPPRKALPSPLAAYPSLVVADGLPGHSRNLVPPNRPGRDTRHVAIHYPAVPPSGSIPYTQSFSPLPSYGNPRGTENEFGDWDTSHIKTPVLTPLRQGAGTADRVGSNRHSADSASPTSRGRRDVQDSTGHSKATPPPSLPIQPPSTLPLPDFIAPQPASKQRYVLAGGDAKLGDRPEISDFALPPALDRGMSLTKEELEQRLLEMSPPRRDSGFSQARPSQDSVSSPASGPVSHDLEEGAVKEKRTRTSSSVSSRILKRIFSRQNSSTE